MNRRQPRKPNRQTKAPPRTAEDHRHVAEAMTGPHLLAAATIQGIVKAACGSDPDQCPDLFEFAASLVRSALEVNNGNLASLEAMLNSQAATANLLFHSIAQYAMTCPKNSETFERTFCLALRAQAQSARTLEVLAGIKQGPRVVFAQQLNAAGQQIVNNGPASMPETPGIVRSAQIEISPPATYALSDSSPIPDQCPAGHPRPVRNNAN